MIGPGAGRGVDGKRGCMTEHQGNGDARGSGPRGAGDASRHRDALPPVSLALQGGGTHGAFTWGVLDRLLQEPGRQLAAVSGTSAGAINAALLAQGLATGGPAAARRALRRFWDRMGALAALGPLQPTAFDRAAGRGQLGWSPAYWAIDLVSRLCSPYDTNAADLNPVRDALAGCLDLETLNAPGRPGPALFVSATHVRSGRVKLFRDGELSLAALMASACLPFLQRAVEIDGEAYWDGGYLGNPAILPLYQETECRDLMLVQVTPDSIDRVPVSPQAIFDRMNTLTFNAGLLRELHLVEQVAARDGAALRLHRVHADDAMRRLDVSSKLNADRGFLEHLFALGHDAAEDWLTAHRVDLGQRGTLNVDPMYL
jgi:NTE family protein